MRLSLYIHLFEKEGTCYLFNSQTGFFSTIEKAAYESLYNGDFESMSDDVIKLLKEKGIIVENDELFNYYHERKLHYLSSIGNQETLNLVIAPTTNCNFACPYCFEGEKQDKRMSQDTTCNLIKFINHHQDTKNLNIIWYGGEPLAAFDIMKDIVSRIKNDCKITLASQTIVTNGYLINKEVIDFMKTNLFKSIQITFDGIKEHHDQTRCLKSSRKPTYEKILLNIDKLLLNTTEQLEISLRININKENEDDFPIMYKLLHERYPNKRVSVYPGFIREEGKRNGQMCYNSIFGKSKFDFYKKMDAKGINVDFYPHEHNKMCMTCLNNSFIIGPDGEIYKCWNDFNNPSKIVGNIRDEKISNPRLISRYVYESTIFSDNRCKECKLFPICDGGCDWLRYQNNFEGKRYDLCTFFSDDEILEQCLLMNQRDSKENCIEAF